MLWVRKVLPKVREQNVQENGHPLATRIVGQYPLPETLEAVRWYFPMGNMCLAGGGIWSRYWTGCLSSVFISVLSERKQIPLTPDNKEISFNCAISEKVISPSPIQTISACHEDTACALLYRCTLIVLVKKAENSSGFKNFWQTALPELLLSVDGFQSDRGLSSRW